MGVWAVLGMLYALRGAEGVDRDWLDGSPFGDYVVPRLILGVIVGGSQLLAAAAVWRRAPGRRVAAPGAAVVLMGWIVVQVAIIGYVSALQPIVLAYALAELALYHRLPRPG